MKITWEDRKQSGFIDGHMIFLKPDLSFQYAWFLVDDHTAQYVESHEYGYWNKPMADAQQKEVVAYYQNWSIPEEAPESLTLEEAKAQKRLEIDEQYSAVLQTILQHYPDAETKTWDKQEQEARAYMADSTSPTPILSEIANARDMALDDLVAKVILKADAWIKLSGAATGKRQRYESQIEAAATIQEVDAVLWE